MLLDTFLSGVCLFVVFLDKLCSFFHLYLRAVTALTVFLNTHSVVFPVVVFMWFFLCWFSCPDLLWGFFRLFTRAVQQVYHTICDLVRNVQLFTENIYAVLSVL